MKVEDLPLRNPFNVHRFDYLLNGAVNVEKIPTLLNWSSMVAAKERALTSSSFKGMLSME